MGYKSTGEPSLAVVAAPSYDAEGDVACPGSVALSIGTGSGSGDWGDLLSDVDMTDG